MLMFRQGDVLVFSVEVIPESVTPVARDAGRIVLAYGEVTGHAHAIMDRDAELLAASTTDDRFLRIMSAVELRHEEHATITLPPGNYIVRRQREYSAKDMAPVRVAD
jgi:hypothetical protein